MALNDFYRGTTKNFTITITYNGAAPDITSDVVTFIVKKNKTDIDAAAKIDKDADVSGGSSGVASFELSPTETDVVSGTYYYEITWKLSGGSEYVLEQGTIQILERVEDVPGT